MSESTNDVLTDDILIEEIYQLKVLLSDLAKALITVRDCPSELVPIVHKALQDQNVPLTVEEIIEQVDSAIEEVKLRYSLIEGD